jgi:hypothetical protein
MPKLAVRQIAVRIHFEIPLGKADPTEKSLTP